MRTAILTLLLSLLIPAAWADEALHGDIAAAKTAWGLIDDGALVIDVRSPEEFTEGHLPGAVNVPYEDLDGLKDAIGDDRDRQTVLYCRSGRRAGIAMEALEKAGYHRLFNATGFDALEATRDDH